jgi:hypothetical protein
MSLRVARAALSATDRGEIERWLAGLLEGSDRAGERRRQGRQRRVARAWHHRKTVTLWRERVVAEGIESLWEIASGRGRKPRYSAAKIEAIVEATLHSKPKGETHWSCRTMARHHGVSRRRSIVSDQPRSEATSQRNVLAVARRAVPGEADRCGRAVSQSTAQVVGAVRRRE